MKKSVFLVFAMFAMLCAGTVFSAPSGRQRAVTRPIRLDAYPPFQIGLRYTSGLTYILTAREDGTLWWIQHLPYALGNKLPETVLNVRGPAEVVVRTKDSVRGLRFYPEGDKLNPGAILPFDPLNPSPEIFTPGVVVENVLKDCPVWGIPNDDVLTSVVAYNHSRRYLVIDPPVYQIMVMSAVLPFSLDGPDGFRLMLMDHYVDGAGQSFVLASQVIRDVNGKIVTLNPDTRVCYVMQ